MDSETAIERVEVNRDSILKISMHLAKFQHLMEPEVYAEIAQCLEELETRAMQHVERLEEQADLVLEST